MSTVKIIKSKQGIKNSKKEPVITEPVITEPVTMVEKKKRFVPTKDYVVEEFDNLIIDIEKEIVDLRDGVGKGTKNVKALRGYCKRIKQLRDHSKKIMKHKKKNISTNLNSGFLKPVPISSELATFTGWDVTQPRSRVDVTKYVCNYISENKLQNPSDRRQIVADKKLSKLLDYDSTNADPLTYYRIQTYLKPHFIKS